MTTEEWGNVIDSFQENKLQAYYINKQLVEEIVRLEKRIEQLEKAANVGY